jgi:FKBP-type peptidyl-prolyl cis-trans isomerase
LNKKASEKKVNRYLGIEKRFIRETFAKTLKKKMSFRDVTVEIFAAGDGNNYPKKGNTVVVHYTGSLKDGTIWDSSRDRGKPFRFKLGADQVIPGKAYCSFMTPFNFVPSPCRTGSRSCSAFFRRKSENDNTG